MCVTKLLTSFCATCLSKVDWHIPSVDEPELRSYSWIRAQLLSSIPIYNPNSSSSQVPNEAAIKPLGGLPNAQYPSDHVPLVFGFRFKKSEAFTSMLPFDRPGGAGRSTEDGAAAGKLCCLDGADCCFDVERR
jgi:hypothetical protein